jgi:hypothetical protein
MRSDAAPAVRVATNTLYGLVKMNSAFLDTAVGNVIGGIACRGPTVWGQLPVGSAGQFLQSNGTGSNPSWVAASSVTTVPDAVIDQMLFGTGQDGTATISSGTTTLLTDMYYSNLTINGTGKLNTNGWRVFVSGTLDISAAGAEAISDFNQPNADGLNSSPASPSGGGGSTGVPNQTCWGACNGTGGGAGGASTVTTGSQAAAQANAANALGGQAGAGGKGGAGAATPADAGGIARNPNTYVQTLDWNILSTTFTVHLGTSAALFGGGGSAPGGSGGGGDGTNSGSGGGGGGGGGGQIFIAARTIARSVSTAAAAITARGRNGGNGGTRTAGNVGAGGGGGGGGGGWLYVIYRFLTGSTATNALDASGGNGGNGGNARGTGLSGGDGGSSGAGGRIDVYNVGTTSFTTIRGNTVTSQAGNAASGQTGGTGGVATVNALNL